VAVHPLPPPPHPPLPPSNPTRFNVFYVFYSNRYNHLKCETAGAADTSKCPITNVVLAIAMDDNQIMIQSTRVLEKAEPLRFRMKDPPGVCKVWTALINKVTCHA